METKSEARGSIEGNGVSVGPEQDWTELYGSWMGSGTSDSFAIADKNLLRKQRISFDEAIDGSKNIDWCVRESGDRSIV